MNDENKFLLALANSLAHSSVFYSNVVGVTLFAGDPPAPSTQESMDSVLAAYEKHLPGLLNITSQNILPTQQALLGANQQLAPQENQLALDLYRQFIPQFTQAGIDVNRQAALGQAGTDLAVLQGPGKQLAAAQLEAQKLADPEYYTARAGAGQALGSLFSSLPDPNGGLSGAEREEITRSVNRDNLARGIENPSAITTVENAMRFGAAGEARKVANEDRISKAVQAATGFMPAAKSGIDVLNTTTGRATINPGQSQFAGVNKDTASNTFNMGSQLLGETSSMRQQQNQINSQRRDGLDRFSQVMGSMPNVGCCWIFLAAHGGELPWWVRKCRDVLGGDDTRRGYTKMSHWLVPLMKRSRLVMWAVRTFMTEPLTEYGGYLVGVNTHGWVFRPIKQFWFAVWNKLGTE